MIPNLKLHTGQQMGMSPQLVASIRLLQLSAAELAQEVAEAIEANPLLEADPAGNVELPVADATEITHQAVVGEAVSAAVMSGEYAPDAAPATRDEIDVDDNFQVGESWSGSAGGEHNPLDWAAAPERGLRAGIEHALDEALDGFTAPLSAAVMVVLAAIDDAGYLREPLPALQTPSITLEQLQAALCLIRRHAPTGFGAADLRECLLLQLDEVRAGTPGKTLAEQLVSDHLADLHPRQREALRQQLGVSAERMAAACGLIRGLDPRPGQDASEIEAKVVVPDVIVSGSAGAWKISLNPATLPKVRLNGVYERLLGSATAARNLKEKLNEARWILRGLEMRHDTLLRTTQAIFERQSAFLEKGDVAMKPLMLKEVAQAIGMHESTVSRVTSAKYVATPWGSFELKRFFSVSLAAGQTEASGVAVRAMIRQLIDAENPAKPLCDGAISALLRRRGVSVARRTVAKYREGMKIASAPERKARQHFAIAV